MENNNNLNKEIDVSKKKFKFKKILTSKWFWVVLIIILVGGGIIFVKIGRGKEKTVYTTQEVKIGKLIQTVTATGEVESVHDIDLNFKTAGRLIYLAVDEGSQVTVGQLLARLSAAAVAAKVQQYQANLDSAKANLKKIKAGSSPEKIQVAQEKLDKAQRDLNSLLVERNDQLGILRERALDNLNNAVFTAQVSLDTIFTNLVDDNTTTNLIVQKSALLTAAESEYYKINSDLNDAKNTVDQANLDRSNDMIIIAADQMRSVLSDLNSLLDDAYQVADSIVINNYYSQADKNTIKSDLDAEQLTNNTSLTNFQIAKSNLVNSINDYNSQIQAAEDNLAIYRAEFDLEEAGPRDFEISSAEAAVVKAQAQLNQAYADLGDYSIVAPISGTITKVNFDVGEQISLSIPVVKMLSTKDYEIKVDIPESDIAKIKVGDKAIIKLDAFGSDKIFAGVVAFIDPAQTVISDVTYYQTTVSFNENEMIEQIKPGMSADITITTAEKDGVLFVPQRAVKIRETVLGEVAEKYVEVLADKNNIEEKIVTIGLRGDGGMVEIKEGLSEGEKVVTFKKNGK